MEGYFRCANIRCIAPDLTCNGNDDCDDNSDETNCPTTPRVTIEPTTTGVCDNGYSACSYNGSCIEDIQVCDGIPDCMGSALDEIYCACPKEGDRRCSNSRCIAPELFCNGKDECGDNSDEANCQTTPMVSTALPSSTEVFMTTDSDSCREGYFECSPGGQCIENIFVCDELIDCEETYEDELYCSCKNETYFRCDNVRCIDPDLICNEVDDCGDKSDERNCSCNEDEFACSDDGPCISNTNVCDSLPDCKDTKADEKNCPCQNTNHFRCANLRCINPRLKCNGRDNCGDMSDEIDCLCPVSSDYRCANRRCINPDLICDGNDDCRDNSDETDCPTTPATDICDPGYFACSHEGPCVEERTFCDAIIDCKETKVDEMNCTCPRNGDWRCANTRCIPPSLICNGENNCKDNSDEENCPTTVATTESSTTTEQIITTDSSTTIELMTTKPDPCPDSFACSAEGPCIDKSLVCDAFVDCPLTKEDEVHCESNFHLPI
ncbi:uncharacterized protein [Amphiura filiformis]|uniref:uncharacterized protein n=1 Tax=Amphiura filiformis TaxID=82378 RepID=UPI003B20DD89